MITLADYFGDKPHPQEHDVNARKLLDAVNKYLLACHDNGLYDWPIDPDTGTNISGAKGGSGDGGYRAADSKTGTAKSAHRTAQAVDVYDPGQVLAKYSDSPTGRGHLARCGLYIEHPRWTPGWVHFQSVPPRSGKRVYVPYVSPPLVAGWEGGTPIPFTIKV